MPLASALISTIGPRSRAEAMTESLIETERLQICDLDLSHADALRAYYMENAAHLDPWEPQRSPKFHTLEACHARIRTAMDERESGRAVKLVLLSKASGGLIGVCNFTNIVRGPFQACTLGYSISAEAQGQGLMFEALGTSLDYMFNQKNLHRVMANYVPENQRSAKLLARLGFEIEGHAKNYLHIAGAWRDHVLTAKTNPDFRFEFGSPI